MSREKLTKIKNFNNNDDEKFGDINSEKLDNN